MQICEENLRVLLFFLKKPAWMNIRDTSRQGHRTLPGSKIHARDGGSMNFCRNSIYNSVGVTKVPLSLLIPLES